MLCRGLATRRAQQGTVGCLSHGGIEMPTCARAGCPRWRGTAIPCKPRRQTAAGLGGSGRLPGSPRARWATSQLPARCLPVAPACSSSSLSLSQAAAEEERNPALRLLAQRCWYAGGGGRRATSRTVKNY